MTNLLECRKSLHQQIVDSQMQCDALDVQMRQLQPLANLGMAWAMTAHELNNLLTPIITYAQLALKNPQDAELGEKALQKAERLSTQAAQMLEKIMVLAHPGTARGGLGTHHPVGASHDFGRLIAHQFCLDARGQLEAP